MANPKRRLQPHIIAEKTAIRAKADQLRKELARSPAPVKKEG